MISSHSRGSLQDFPAIVNAIRRSWTSGRLTLRSTLHVGLVHLYFRSGKLVHVVSSSGDASATLAALQRWEQAMVHFERGSTKNEHTVSIEHERMFDELLSRLQRLYGYSLAERSRVSPRMMQHPEGPRIPLRPHSPQMVESHIVATPGMEWRILIEATRRVSLAVARLVGPQEALSVLGDILEDFSSAFPALPCLQIAAGGYLQVIRTVQLDHIARAEVIKGFAALIATCRYYCSPIIGDENADRLILQALYRIVPALTSLGVFEVR